VKPHNAALCNGEELVSIEGSLFHTHSLQSGRKKVKQ
jgi:hypothetical protein